MTTPRVLWSLAVGLAFGPLAAAQDVPAPPEAAIGQAFRIPYRLTETNHYLVRVRINGKGPFNFLVDSGAPALYVGTAAARAVGLTPPETGYWTPVDRLDLEGGATLRNLKARVEDPFQLVGMNALGLPGASIDGILGFTILARFRLEFDPTSDRMTWTRIDYTPREPYVPRELTQKGARTRKAPAEVQAMEALGPLMKLAAVFVGKQPEETLQPRGTLGIALKPAPEGEGQGVIVASVLPGSPAADAQLEPGDRLVRLADREIASTQDALLAVAQLRPGAAVPVRIVRQGETLDRTIQAGSGF
jgi:hypothetical protein